MKKFKEFLEETTRRTGGRLNVGRSMAQKSTPRVVKNTSDDETEDEKLPETPQAKAIAATLDNFNKASKK